MTIHELAQKNWKKLDTLDSNAEFVACVECHCTECHYDKYGYPECWYAKCCYTECHYDTLQRTLTEG